MKGPWLPPPAQVFRCLPHPPPALGHVWHIVAPKPPPLLPQPPTTRPRTSQTPAP